MVVVEERMLGAWHFVYGPCSHDEARRWAENQLIPMVRRIVPTTNATNPHPKNKVK